MIGTTFYYILAYFILIFSISYFTSRKQKNEDFLIGSRELNVFSFIATLVSSKIGGTVLIVYTAYIFQYGLPALFGFIGLFIGLLLFIPAAKKLQKLSKKKKFYTLSDFFGYYYGDNVARLTNMIVVALLILIILKQIIAGTYVISILSDFSYEMSLILIIVFITVSLMFGGFKSMVKTHFIQIFLLIFLLFFVGFMLKTNSEISINIFESSSISISLMLSFLIYGILSVWYAPELWQRVYASKNQKVVNYGLIGSGFFLLLIGLGLAFISLVIRNIFPLIDPSQALVYGMKELLNTQMLGFGTLMLFVAILSSADAMVFVLASSTAKIISKKQISNVNSFRLMIFLILVIVGTLAYFFRDIVDIALINVGLGLAITPAIIGTFFLSFNRKSVIYSIYGGIFYVILCFVFSKITPETMTFTFFFSFLIIFLSEFIHKNSNIFIQKS